MSQRPEFLLIPMVVYDHKDLSPTDKIVYGVVYWFEHMRYGKCIASNKTIAAVVKVDERTVRVGLERLEGAGFIRRDFKDKARKIRQQIHCIVQFAPPGEQQEVIDEQQTTLPGLEVKEETPGEFAKRFFSGDAEAVGALGKELEDSGVPREMVIKELLKFKAYWTEPTKSGKKQRWETERVFEVKRRLGTWFRNIAERQGARGRAGAGVSV